MGMNSEDMEQPQEDISAVGAYRWYADLYDQTQAARIATQNRFHALERERVGSKAQMNFLGNTVQQLRSMERAIERHMQKELKQHVLYEWFSQVEGVGPILATKLLSFIEDINRFNTVSKLWRYAGLAVMDGKAERRRRGQQLHYNSRFKSTMYMVGTAIMRRRGAYKTFYDAAKLYYKENRPDWDDGHIHIASMRRMEKAFLADLWEAWRKVEAEQQQE